MYREGHYTQIAYSVRQAGKLLGMRQEAVRQQIRTGHIRASRLGRRYMISREEIERIAGQAAPEVGR